MLHCSISYSKSFPVNLCAVGKHVFRLLSKDARFVWAGPKSWTKKTTRDFRMKFG
jgi:hypothetical protein